MLSTSGDCPIFSTTGWNTNNLSTTTTACQHAPKKRICKKAVLLAVPLMQKCILCGGIAFYFGIGSKGSSQVPFSSIFGNLNTGIGIPITTTPGAGLRTKEPCQQGLQTPYFTPDHGSGWAAFVGKDG